MRQVFLVMVLLVSISGFAQIKYESGYFIDNNGLKTNCLIKNVDWKENPTGFSYKPTADATPKTATLDSVMEFGIYNESKFRRFTVDIDRSADGLDLSNASNEKEPKFKKETLFLKPLIESKASLYYYEGLNIVRYFYTIDTANAKQLVYKQYVDAESNIKKNNAYKTQLWTDLQCPQLTMEDIESTQYETDDLVKVFNKYNQANGAMPVVNGGNPKVKRAWGHLNIRPGIVQSSLNAISDGSGFQPAISADFGTKETFRLGAEGEIILPFNKNKWSLFLEPTYRDYKSSYTFVDPLLLFNSHVFTINYQNIEVPFGLRHYLFLNDNSKLFINVSYTIHFLVGAYYKQDGQSYPQDLYPTNSYQLGFGYTYRNKVSIEARFEPSRQIIDYSFWTSSNYNNTSLILGYRLF